MLSHSSAWMIHYLHQTEPKECSFKNSQTTAVTFILKPKRKKTAFQFLLKTVCADPILMTWTETQGLCSLLPAEVWEGSGNGLSHYNCCCSYKGFSSECRKFHHAAHFHCSSAVKASILAIIRCEKDVKKKQSVNLLVQQHDLTMKICEHLHFIQCGKMKVIKLKSKLLKLI